MENQENTLPSLMTDLDELSEQLLEKFLDIKTYNAKERRDIMQEYNKVAEAINKKAGFKRVITLTPSTRIEFKKTDVPKIVSKDNVRDLPLQRNNVESPEAPGHVLPITKQIIVLYKAGKSSKEIIAMGFNKSTVARQISEYKKLQK